MSVKEKRHMLILIIAVLMLGYMLIRPLLVGSGRASQPRTPAQRERERNLEPDYPVVEAQTRIHTGSEGEEGEQEEKEEPSFSPGQVLGDTELWKKEGEQGTVTFDAFNQAVELVCDLTEEDLEKAAVQKDFSTIRQEEYPEYRGRVFRVKGYFLDGPQLVRISLKKEVIRKLPYVAKMYRGVFKQADSGRKTACVGIGIFEGYILDRPVYFYGIFAGMETIPTGESKETVPLFVYRQLHLVEVNPVAGIKEFKPGLKLGSKKIWELADDRLYDVIELDPYYHAIEILVNISQEDLEACIDPELTYPKMIRLKNDPSQYRGKVFRLKGRLLRLEEKKADPHRAVCRKFPHHDAGQPLLFVGQILESNTKKPFTFRALDIPDDLVVGDYVDMVGIFVKRFTYENRKGENWYTKTPLIMGKKIKKFERVFHIMPIVGGIGISVFVLIVVAALYERKKYREYQERMKESKERKRMKLSAGSAPLGNKKPPEDGKENTEGEQAEEDDSLQEDDSKQKKDCHEKE